MFFTHHFPLDKYLNILQFFGKVLYQHQFSGSWSLVR
jgi:hypothetical protein